ncbi:hypothetical protein CN177_17115 [Sinorhizobium meliloti]|nr:hypothetical protein CN219_23770 [Sinorhizobium meliloti]RVI36980.1 hypothetical protein CN197_10325 [Sinorhizobium meliloti]RVI47112.1 hypothetical protein CN196_08215 [Sinorhizobium meliloti]RVJ23926.1 hypothetical protein CN177_17115 [Sinorhizobium meliloti]RVJ94844.1 hypothetical protein CN170_22300 [Sinorhizobium meliloti]
MRDYGVEGQIGLERTLAEALDVTEHEADRLINARLNCGYAERLHARRIKRIAYAGKEPFVSEWAR